jgi:hypothetical protein
MLLRITNGFEKLSDAALIAKAELIMTGMTGNANFPTPSPTLPVFQAGIDDFQASLGTAQGGGNYDKAVKNQKREELIDLIHSLSYYVLFTANGNRLIAQSSNLTIAKSPAPAPEVREPLNLQLDVGSYSGDLNLEFSKVPGARSYIYEIAQSPLTNNTAWTSKTGTIKKTTFNSLVPGERYHVRVMAVGINGQGVYSQTVSRIAQ